MKILLISNSARGHAVAEALARSKHQPEIVACSTTKNPGLEKLCAEQHVMDILNFEEVLNVASASKFDFAFIAPDDPIGMGLADELEKIGIPSVAPKKELAQIESSKSFARNLLETYARGASPSFYTFIESEEKSIRIFMEQLGGNYVVKYDALKGGKGVKVSGEHLHSIDEGVAYALECIRECGRVVVEEKLIGIEFSLMSFVSGFDVVDMPAIQDHKRAFVGDTGPNTGGMGTYSDANHSLPFLTDAELKEASHINQIVANNLEYECDEPYKGILYGGFIATKDGVKVIEYNARFGDPEALNVLPLLETDFVEICLAIIAGKLTPEHVRFSKKATVCKYITPKGYPENKDQKGQIVTFPEMPENAKLYYGDLSQDENGELHLGTSRAAGIVGIGDTLEEAEIIAQSLCEKVQGPVRFRSDIGTNELIGERIAVMKRLQG